MSLIACRGTPVSRRLVEDPDPTVHALAIRAADHPPYRRLTTCKSSNQPSLILRTTGRTRSGMTCWRRLTAGTRPASETNCTWAAEDAAGREEARLAADGDRLLPRWGRSACPKWGPSPVDRARSGSNHHVLTHSQGIPLAVPLTGGIRNDVTQLLPLLDDVPAVTGVGAQMPCSLTGATTTTSTGAPSGQQASGDRRTRPGTRLWPARLPLGGRAHHRLAARLPPSADPLGTRPPRGSVGQGHDRIGVERLRQVTDSAPASSAPSHSIGAHRCACPRSCDFLLGTLRNRNRNPVTSQETDDLQSPGRSLVRVASPGCGSVARPWSGWAADEPW